MGAKRNENFLDIYLLSESHIKGKQWEMSIRGPLYFITQDKIKLLPSLHRSCDTPYSFQCWPHVAHSSGRTYTPPPHQGYSLSLAEIASALSLIVSPPTPEPLVGVVKKLPEIAPNCFCRPALPLIPISRKNSTWPFVCSVIFPDTLPR